MSDAVKTEVRGQVLEVTLDRPKANAIDSPTSQEMGRVFAEFRDNDELRVAIVTGGGDRDPGCYRHDLGAVGFACKTELSRFAIYPERGNGRSADQGIIS